MYIHIVSVIRKIIYTLKVICIPSHKRILINSCMSNTMQFKHLNFGDDLNLYLISELTDRNVINSNSVYLPVFKNYMVIGSIIDWMSNKNSIVWGSGVVRKDSALKIVPRKICAVRGKLTRQYLQDRGVNCPEVYGDPALLLPLIFRPKTKKKYKYGLIPHVVDLESTAVKLFLSKNTSSTVISLKDYVDWHDVINKIHECEYIISSSLHGIIISDAYHIPNVWVSFSQNITGGDFKFLDYFSAVNRFDRTPVIIINEINIKDIEERLLNYKRIEFDSQKLINSCPFEINIKHQLQ